MTPPQPSSSRGPKKPTSVPPPPRTTPRWPPPRYRSPRANSFPCRAHRLRQVHAAQPGGGADAAVGRTRARVRRNAGRRQHACRLPVPGRHPVPWRSALDNVKAGLSFHRVPAAEAEARARNWLSRVGLAAHVHKLPHELSGGMRKRVALAQTLVLDPNIILMDEPFSALDVQTRLLMENELLDLWMSSRKTVLFVTHDLEEAISLSDRVVVLSAGPATRPIAEFAIDLPRPRDVSEIRLTPEFSELHRKIWDAMKNEVLKAYAGRTH
ncbi:ABC transporter, ATP-binding domain protein [Bordetella bronchiseptica SBL-F6116]|nr:ABC transporter, ATP-binding domain protein [Bordetella bronchiseptica SBL-F6116]